MSYLFIYLVIKEGDLSTSESNHIDVGGITNNLNEDSRKESKVLLDRIVESIWLDDMLPVFRAFFFGRLDFPPISNIDINPKSQEIDYWNIFIAIQIEMVL